MSSVGFLLSSCFSFYFIVRFLVWISCPFLHHQNRRHVVAAPRAIGGWIVSVSDSTASITDLPLWGWCWRLLCGARMATSVATSCYLFFLSNKTVFLGRQGTVAEELSRTWSMFAQDLLSSLLCMPKKSLLCCFAGTWRVYIHFALVATLEFVPCKKEFACFRHFF